MAVGNQAAGGGGGASAGAIRAGKAVVEIGGDDSKLAKVLSGIKSRVLFVGSSLRSLGGVSIGAGLAGMVPMLALLKSGVDRAEQIGDISDVFGLSPESASRMASAIEIAGGSIEEFEMSLSKLAAISKDGEPLDETLLRVADALGEIDDKAERFQAAKEIFGAKFAKSFIDTGSDVGGFLKESPTLTKEQIDRSKELNREFAKTGIVLKSALLPVLEILVPIVKKFAEFLRENADLLVVAFKVAAGMVAFGAASFALGSAMSVLAGAGGLVVRLVSGLWALMKVLTAVRFATIAQAIASGIAAAASAVWALVTGGLSAAIAILGGAISFLLSPIGLVTLAVAGMVYLFRDELAGAAESWFGGVASIATETWGGIVAAIKSGDIEQAMEIVGAGLKAIWAQTLLSLAQMWNVFMKSLRESAKGTGFIGGLKAGFIGGAVGPDLIADALSLDEAGLRAKLAAARADLTTAVGRVVAAATGGPQLSPGAKEKLAGTGDAVKGAFQTFGISGQRFGFGDNIQKDQLAALLGIKNGDGELPNKIGKASAEALTKLFKLK